jgi:hypothetical protein
MPQHQNRSKKTSIKTSIPSTLQHQNRSSNPSNKFDATTIQVRRCTTIQVRRYQNSIIGKKTSIKTSNPSTPQHQKSQQENLD